MEFTPKYWILIIIAIVVGVVWGYQSSVYQGKTAREWATISQQKDQKIASMSAEIQSDNFLIQTINLSNETTPTLSPSQTPEVRMPSWCSSTIHDYEATYQPLGYSQGAINELLKKNNPECATY